MNGLKLIICAMIAATAVTILTVSKAVDTAECRMRGGKPVSTLYGTQCIEKRKDY